MFSSKQLKITNWGNFPVIDAEIFTGQTDDDYRNIINYIPQGLIPRGLGRCYGDSSLSANIIDMTDDKEIIKLDDGSGLLTARAGLSLQDILQFVVQKRWFLPVTPGTQFITLGGAIASDVHGKNHHIAGCFSEHVTEMKIMQANGEILTCSDSKNQDWFRATCGGMGLTGIILEVTIQLLPIETAFINQQTDKAANLDGIMRFFERRSHSSYSVAWINCLAKGKNLGRSVLMSDEHAKTSELPLNHQPQPLDLNNKFRFSVPFFFPGFLLNRWSVKSFNTLFYAKAKAGNTLIDYESFFYPLDAIHNWNRIYGKRGFTQYQFVLPVDKSFDGLKEILELIASSGKGSFLAVLKLFGKENSNWLSFPKEGYTLALDFPLTTFTRELFRKLDDLVLKNDGRLYLTKDVRMGRNMVEMGYDNLPKFKEFRKKHDLGFFTSLQAQRLGL